LFGDRSLIGISSDEYRIVVLSAGDDQALLASRSAQIRATRKQQGISP
jgi:hypothetical protein